MRAVPPSVKPDRLLTASMLATAVAALLVSFDRPEYLIGAAVALGGRAILDRMSAALARAREALADEAAEAERLRSLRAAVEAVGVLVLYGGLFCHVQLHPPPAGLWSEYLSPTGVLTLAMLQALARGAAAAHYQGKPLSRFISGVWAVSNLEAFLLMTALSLVVDQLWLGQVLFATVGVAWILATVLISHWSVRTATRRDKLVVA